MSFILDALKKSEQERRQGEVPDLQTPQEIASKRSSGRAWVYLLAAAVLLVNGILAAWLLWPGKPEPSPQARIVPSSPARPAAEPEPDQPVQAPPRATALSPVPTPALGPEPQPPVAVGPPPGEVLPAAAPPPMENPIVRPLMELTPADRARLPDIDLQLHFYTARAQRRMVRLNNVILREGERGGEGITVVEITPEGVIMDFGGMRFLYPARRN